MERIKEAIARANVAQKSNRRETQRAAPELRQSAEPSPTRLSLRPATLDHSLLLDNRIVSAETDDPRRGPFDMLRTRVIQVMADQGWRTLAITSPTTGTGKTVVSINLSISLARLADQPTMLVDFDMRKPQVAEYLGLDGDYSLVDLLAGRITLDNILVDSGISNLIILPNSAPVPGSSEFIASPAVGDLIRDLKAQDKNGLIVFDLPPMLVADDALAFLPHVDCVILVTSVRQSKLSELRECEQKLGDANYLGFILNKDVHESVQYY